MEGSGGEDLIRFHITLARIPDELNSDIKVWTTKRTRRKYAHCLIHGGKCFINTEPK